MSTVNGHQAAAGRGVAAVHRVEGRPAGSGATRSGSTPPSPSPTCSSRSPTRGVLVQRLRPVQLLVAGLHPRQVEEPVRRARTCARPWRTASRSAFLATVVATVLGTMIAFALARHRFRGRTATNLLIFLPMATPEVVMGASLLALFLNLGINLGFTTIVIAHVMFCISLRRRHGEGADREPGPAARAGGDGPLRRRGADLPPGHAAAGGAGHPGRRPCWRSRCRSTTSSSPTSTRATVNTFPKFVYVSSLRGIPAQANVIGSAMFFIALIAVLIGQVVTAGRKRQKA